MFISKKASVTLILLSAILFYSVAALPPDHDDGFKNLKVLPKKISHQQLHNVMENWSQALGVHCGFCHARNDAAKTMDFVSDAKPEKEMARHMFKMTAQINKKFFKAEKDTLGMVMESSVNCNTCHNGKAHPELKMAEMRPPGPGGPGGPGPGGPGGPGGPNGPGDKKPM